MKTGLVFLFVSFLLILGCKNEDSNQENVKIEVITAGEKELSELINNRNGKYLFLNIWATWCIPCVEEFPDIVKLSEKYSSEKFDFASLSIDYLEEKDKKVIPFLTKMNAKFSHYINGFKKDEMLINFISEDWSGAVPLTLIYDSSGKQIAFLEGAHTYDQFVEKIESLIK